MDEIVTVKEAAKFLHKHPGTIRHWIEDKKLAARKLSVGKNGVYAITRSDLLELAVKNTLQKKSLKLKPKKSKPSSTNQIHLPL